MTTARPGLTLTSTETGGRTEPLASDELASQASRIAETDVPARVRMSL